MTKKPQPITIKLFLINGAPSGLRTAEISNWTGKAFACPRMELVLLFEKSELASPGVYFLIGADPETGVAEIYIGEAESVRERLKGHKAKDFWTSVIVFISKDDTLNKAHIRYLEGRLIERLVAAGKAKSKNAASSGSKLADSDTADMDFFLSRIYQLLPILGVHSFEEPPSKVTDTEKVLYCRVNEIVATGWRTPDGFLVTKGSQASNNNRLSASEATKKMRNTIIESGLLELEGDHYVFTKDYEFSSPSAAAGIIVGGSANGLTVWRTLDGRTLKDSEV